MSSDVSTEKIRFQFNICDARNDLPPSQFGREVPTYAGCGSTVRRRALMRILSREIFGMHLRISDFPVLKGIRGLGMSDSLDYAQTLAEKFDYPNTYYDREPKFDIPWWINTNSDPMIRDIQRGPRSRGRSGRDGV